MRAFFQRRSVALLGVAISPPSRQRAPTSFSSLYYASRHTYCTSGKKGSGDDNSNEPTLQQQQSRAKTQPRAFDFDEPLGRRDGDDAVATADTTDKTATTSGMKEPELVLDDTFMFFPTQPEEQTVRVPGTPVPPPGHRRYVLQVQYVGTKYYGWLRRALKGTLPTVQDAVEDAIAVALNVDHLEVVSGCLTEAGVHARRLTCHVDVPESVEVPTARAVLSKCATWLGKRGDEIAVLSFEPAPEGFHAQHSAVSRTYVYRIANRVAPPLMEKGHIYHFDRPLNVANMSKAALYLEGEHDFGNFADHRVGRLVKRYGGTYTVRTLDSLKVVRQADEVLVWFTAKSFVRHQTRNIVSSLLMVGTGAWEMEDVDYVLSQGFKEGRRRTHARPPPAPVEGLTLWDVNYAAPS